MAPRRRAISRDDLRDQHPDVARIIAGAMDEPSPVDDMLVALGRALSLKRDDAVSARRASGIEDIWRRCEDHYEGVDDANRVETQSARWSKPLAADGPVTTGRSPPATTNRSTIFIRLTQRYVDAADAKLAEIILPPDEKAYSFTETPVPDLIAALADKSQVVDDSTGTRIPLTRPARQDDAAAQGSVASPGVPAAGAAPPANNPLAGGAAAPTTATGSPPSPQGPMPPGVMSGSGASPPLAGGQRVPLTVADLAQEAIDTARAAAKYAEQQIYDWQVEQVPSYRAENRKVLADSAKLGVGVLKGPVPQVKKEMAVVKNARTNRPEVIYRERVIPASLAVNPWNFFPDPACGEHPHRGEYAFERDYFSERRLLDLKNEDGYIADQIDAVVDEGPGKVVSQALEKGATSSEVSNLRSKNTSYEVWYYYGFISNAELYCACQHGGVAYAAVVGDHRPSQARHVPVIATVVNDRVIKAAPASLGSGNLPFKVFPWTPRRGYWAGIGVAEQMFAPQRMLNGAVRAMMNNAGKAAGSQIIINQAAVRPADGTYEITPDKIWYVINDFTGTVEDAFQLVKVPNTTPELMQIVEFSLQMAEEHTSIPLVSQGMTAPETPETYGATQILNSNANQLVRNIGYRVDDYMTEPMTVDYYEWYLLDEDVPDDKKGDFAINARGSVAMVERAIQDMTILQMGPLTINPAYGMNPRKWSREMIKSKKLNPADFMYTKEEQAKIDSTPPPQDPRVQVAQITMEGWKAEAGIKSQADIHKVDVDSQNRQEELKMKTQLALIEYANQHKMKLAEVQAEYDNTRMKLDAQLNLARQEHLVDAAHADRGHAVDLQKQQNQHSHEADKQRRDHAHEVAIMPPPAQLPGRAANGRAFTQKPARTPRLKGRPASERN